MRKVLLNDGNKIPEIGLGTYLTPPEETKRCVLTAFEAGYRHVDTARFYYNEEGVGKAIKESHLKREDVFITTKIWTTDCYYDKALLAVRESLEKLDTEYIDLVLVHWPPVNEDLKGAWKALEEMVQAGFIKSIGVSNFKKHHIEKLLNTAKIKPAINQVEMHPYFQQVELREYCKKHNIIIEAWAPLLRGKVLGDKTLCKIATKYNKTVAQITIKWAIQEGVVPLPKSVTDERIKENIQIFDFELTKEDMQEIRCIDKNKRFFKDPDSHGF